jgi:hypothetical protein
LFGAVENFNIVNEEGSYLIIAKGRGLFRVYVDLKPLSIKA